MHRLVIGAPFGNYINWPYTTPTLGTFTAEYRGGFWYRLWRVLLTVRPYPGIGAWKNRLGLPNPGIAWLKHEVAAKRIDVSDKIVSIAARHTFDWYLLLCAAESLQPLAVELNVSCPNYGDVDRTAYEEIFRLAAVSNMEVIVKLPLVNYDGILSLAVSQGLSSFHCCNTLPTPGGGLSGKPLKPLALECVRKVRAKLGRHARTIIGGGGVTDASDAVEYLSAGATNVAVASALFNPLRWPGLRTLARQLECKPDEGEVDRDTRLKRGAVGRGVA